MKSSFTKIQVWNSVFVSFFEVWKNFNKKVAMERYTLPETNIAPENGWLEYSFPFGMAYFQGRTVSFGECILRIS